MECRQLGQGSRTDEVMTYTKRIDLPRQEPEQVGLFEGFLLDAAFKRESFEFEHYFLEEGIESVLYHLEVDASFL